MKKYYIDSYHYCTDELKEKYYREHETTTIEKHKTEEFMNKMRDFIIRTHGEDALGSLNMCPEGNIHFREEFGYITIGNYDRDEVTVAGYGKTIEEAFLNALIDYEFYECECYEWSHRQELNMQYSERFLNGDYSKKDYHGPFFFAELALQDFRKYFGDNIPEEIVEYYEIHLAEVGEGNFKYDYETNRLIKVNEKEKIKK